MQDGSIVKMLYEKKWYKCTIIDADDQVTDTTEKDSCLEDITFLEME